jgi:hypothetical protein
VSKPPFLPDIQVMILMCFMDSFSIRLREVGSLPFLSLSIDFFFQFLWSFLCFMDEFAKGKAPPNNQRLSISGNVTIWDCHRGYMNEVPQCHTMLKL